ncbi:MAG: hypothetical protein OET90_08070 [Desulfuromonadales bacterium]|nr:hypothetical protein [Desulfuromonadales bacterium]
MKRKPSIIFLGIALTLICAEAAELPYLNSALPVEQRVEDLLKRMTLQEKIGQMCQYTGEPKYGEGNTVGLDALIVEVTDAKEAEYARRIQEKAALVKKGEIGSFMVVPGIDAANYLQKVAESSRLKIPLLVGTDAVHGHGQYTAPSTVLPTQLCIASTFDIILAEQVARLTRSEMRATGYHWTYSPYVSVTRDPRWGRAGENFGEDPFLVGQLGRAMVRGFQGKSIDNTSVLACVKAAVECFALNGINAGEADVSERTLRSLYLPPYKDCIDEGVATLMASHNILNGVPCHANKWLLTDIMRGEWGFDGFIISDWCDVAKLHTLFKVAPSREAASGMAVNAGIDVHMQGGGFFDHIEALVKEGVVSEDRVDFAVKRILESKFRLGLFENRYIDRKEADKIVLCQEHKDAALDMARKSIILLKNKDNMLPLDPKIKSVFVTGPSADAHYQLGTGQNVNPRKMLLRLLKESVKRFPKTQLWTFFPAVENLT